MINHNDQLSGTIIGLAMKVHRVLGPGFLESVYRKALAYEIKRAGVNLETEKSLQVYYEDIVVGDFKTDILVNDELVIELKAVEHLTKIHEVQTVNYLTATRMDLGLLLNFGAPSLQFKRKYRTLNHLRNPDNNPGTP
jgi:GxxExxY protein